MGWMVGEIKEKRKKEMVQEMCWCPWWCHCPLIVVPPLITVPPLRLAVVVVVVVVVPPVLLSCPIVVGSLLSTHSPPCEQGLTTVVAGAGQLHCPGVIVAIVVVVFQLVTKKDC